MIRLQLDIKTYPAPPSTPPQKKGISPIHPLELVKESGIPPELQYREWNPPQLSKPDKSPPWLVFTAVFADVAVGPTCQSAGPTCQPPTLSFLSLRRLPLQWHRRRRPAAPAVLRLYPPPPRACPPPAARRPRRGWAAVGGRRQRRGQGCGHGGFCWRVPPTRWSPATRRDMRRTSAARRIR